MKTSSIRVFAGFLLILGTAFVISAQGLPVSAYEPLGSGALPKVLALIICVLSAIILIFPARGDAVEATAANEPQESRAKHVVLAIQVMGLFTAYIIIMQADLLGFVVATVLFLIAVMTVMVRNDPKVKNSPVQWMVTIFIALAVSTGLHFVFTKLLVVNLP